MQITYSNIHFGGIRFLMGLCTVALEGETAQRTADLFRAHGVLSESTVMQLQVSPAEKRQTLSLSSVTASQSSSLLSTLTLSHHHHHPPPPHGICTGDNNTATLKTVRVNVDALNDACRCRGRGASVETNPANTSNFVLTVSTGHLLVATQPAPGMARLARVQATPLPHLITAAHPRPSVYSAEISVWGATLDEYLGRVGGRPASNDLLLHLASDGALVIDRVARLAKGAKKRNNTGNGPSSMTICARAVVPREELAAVRMEEDHLDPDDEGHSLHIAIAQGALAIICRLAVQHKTILRLCLPRDQQQGPLLAMLSCHPAQDVLLEVECAIMPMQPQDTPVEAVHDIDCIDEGECIPMTQSEDEIDS